MSDARWYALCPIQGQGQEPFKVGNLAIFSSYLISAIYNGSWQLTTDS